MIFINPWIHHIVRGEMPTVDYSDSVIENLAFLILCVCTIGALALMVYSIFFHELSPFVVYIMAVTGVVLACVWYLYFKTR